MEEGKKLLAAKPIYMKLLIAAIVIYIIGSCIIHTDLYHKVCEIEHKLSHISCGHQK